jgi:hypothetical protein
MGPILQTEMANARCSSFTRSDTIPGAVEIMTLPKNAPMNRTIISASIDLANAQGIIKTVKMPKHTTDTGFLPYTSLSGAINMDPIARPIR